MFQFAGYPSRGLWIHPMVIGVFPIRFPHSEIRGSQAMCASPRLFAAYRVFLRLPVPRHPSRALFRLTSSLHYLLFLSFLGSLFGFQCAIWKYRRNHLLSHGFRHSTIGRARLNRRVRYGYGCVPRSHHHAGISTNLFVFLSSIYSVLCILRSYISDIYSNLYFQFSSAS